MFFSRGVHPLLSQCCILNIPLYFKKFLNSSPTSAKINKFPPLISGKLINFPHIFVQFTFFGFPYYGDDAFTHHALLIVDALPQRFVYNSPIGIPVHGRI